MKNQNGVRNLGVNADEAQHIPPDSGGFSPMALRIKVASYAKELGFDLCGFSPAKIEDKYLKVFEDWLEEGLHADMSYMEKIEQRRNLQNILPGAKSVVVLAVNYNREQKPLSPGHGRVARYAYGRDYHKVIGGMLKKLEKFICGLEVGSGGGTLFLKRLSSAPSAPEILCKSYVDTGPVLERAFAEQAGLGQIGKNGCLITREFGSWVFLSEVITTLDLNVPAPDLSRDKNIQEQDGLLKPLSDGKSVRAHTFSPVSGLAAADQSSENVAHPGAVTLPSDALRKAPHPCGNCTKCITACPTGAIIRPGVVDARLCISYLTIENRDKIPAHLAAKIKETQRIFGCDICQEVCPHNIAKAKLLTNQGLNGPAIAGDQLSIKEVLKIENSPDPDKKFLETFAGSPVMRTKRKGLTRNMQILK